jgi:predicted glutamine amidotransferase
MSSLYPATVSLSLGELARHGGETGPHEDGWGTAYYEGRDVRLIKEPTPASRSDCVRFVEQLELRSSVVLSHIRKATHGEVALHNTQPFSRELGGRMHVFAHNGDLGGRYRSLPLAHHRPVGDTDSEHAFCSLLGRMAPLWRAGHTPSLESRLDVLAELAASLRDMGPANFLYSDGDALFVHADRRSQRDGGPARPPGLVMLCRSCQPPLGAATDLAGVRLKPGEEPLQRVTLVASVPLTDEPWRALDRGTILALRGGEVVAGDLGEQEQAIAANG